MQIGMNLPVMAPGLDRTTFLQWCHEVDEGPWSSLALGERINFLNPDAIVALSAAAAVTERVQITANVLVPALHHPVLLAKQLATIDVLAPGRLTVGVGVGGREEDHLAVGADWNVRRLDVLEERVQAMRDVWRGQLAHPDALLPVEPRPAEANQPEILAGSLGPISIRRAAKWADGVLGFSFLLGEDELRSAADQARAAWDAQDRPTPPRLVTGCWFSLGESPDDSVGQMHEYLTRYLNFLGPMAEPMIQMVPFHDPARLQDGLAAAAELGFDELLLTPTTADPAELERAANLLF